ncbi:hypothetical protein CASFOL_014080 [Castilleja foliolosa]|uniref:Uncharacterized protein n=1 Tax=Castilleja foliolosa TaxID=1961234 RepID=A0ABD3DLV6_9LAMI
MNTRHIFTCDFAAERIVLSSEASPPSRIAPTFMVRLAMRISRSRWYKFLRRVFHYQNGSNGSDLGPNPFDSKNWMIMELIALVVQISLSLYTLIASKGERPVWPMRLWVSGYAFGCYLSLVVLYFRYRLVHTTHRDDINGEQHINLDQSRILQYMQKCKTSLELLFAIWFVMGNVWVFDSRFGSYNRAPKLHILCISLLAWNAVSYSFPFVVFVLLCCCVPLLSSLLGYNMNTASLQRGATDEQLAGLPSWKYNYVSDDVEAGNSAEIQSVVYVWPSIEIWKKLGNCHVIICFI